MDTVTDVNVDRLRDALEFITTHPAAWNQEVYVNARSSPRPVTGDEAWNCGTTACLAGWTALRAGWFTVPGSYCVVDAPGPADARRPADEVAQELLGLSRGQADLLFFSDCNLRDLWEFARAFTDGALVVPPAVVAAEEPCHYDPDDEDYYRSL